MKGIVNQMFHFVTVNESCKKYHDWQSWLVIVIKIMKVAVAISYNKVP